MDSSYPFEDNQLIEELARNLNLATPEYSALPEAEKTLDLRASEDLFNLLLRHIIFQQEIYVSIPKFSYRQRVTNLFDRLSPTIWMKLSLMGASCFISAAISLGLFSPTATAPIRIYIYLFGFFGLLFAILWEVRWLRQLSVQQVIHNPKEIACLDFEVARAQAIGYELDLVNRIIKTANFSKQVIQYVENKIHYELSFQTQQANLANKIIKLAAISIVLSLVYTSMPLQLLLNSILLNNLVILNSIVAVIAVLGAGVILFAEWVGDTVIQGKITSYKICENLLKQARVLLE
ncbi:hypothetical protein B7486_26960 [cyanobacterium TDX16]|nr:hypothetical protein B7486_26960 [cyanobacterium TDX16]